MQVCGPLVPVDLSFHAVRYVPARVRVATPQLPTALADLDSVSVATRTRSVGQLAHLVPVLHPSHLVALAAPRLGARAALVDEKDLEALVSTADQRAALDPFNRPAIAGAGQAEGPRLVSDPDELGGLVMLDEVDDVVDRARHAALGEKLELEFGSRAVPLVHDVLAAEVERGSAQQGRCVCARERMQGVQLDHLVEFCNHSVMRDSVLHRGPSGHRAIAGARKRL